MGLAALLVLVASASADPKPLGKAEQAKVDKAIEKAVAFLKKAQTKQGDFDFKMYYEGRYLVGQCALPAYAMLEAGVPATDPVIQKAADYIRSKILKSEQTYELSLGVLFFDRLGEPKDKKLIQTLALRLVAGVHRTGGWNYRCPTLREADEATLLKLLGDLEKSLKAGEPLNAKSLNALHVPLRLKPLTVFQDPKRLKWVEPISAEFSRQSQLFAGTTDNSNTQFAMLGLWAAQRHDISVGPAFRLMVERFEKMQRKDGWWSYDFRFYPRDKVTPTPSMICVGLMGLAIGRGVNKASTRTSPPVEEDRGVLNGLAALYQQIGFPTNQMNDSIPLPKVHYGWHMYFFWSVERVAMLYNLPTIGDKDWYRWGAEMLVVNQDAGGKWVSANGDGPIVETSFALLFLKCSHPMRDLTPKLPFTAKELNEGITRRLSSGSIGEKSISAPSSNTKPER